MTGMNRTTGKPMDETAHIAQSIGDILTTRIGTRVMRRDYGSLLPDLVDSPLGRRGQMLVFAATAEAIRRWEPRVKLTRVRLAAQVEPGQATLDLEGERIRAGEPNERIRLSIPLPAGALPASVN